MLRWLIEHTNVSANKIYNEKGKWIMSFLPIDLEEYYKFTKNEVFMTNEWMWEFYCTHNYYDFLENWYEECIVLKSKDTRMYPTTKFKAIHMYETQLVIILYGEKSSSYFKLARVPLLQEITKYGIVFNSEVIPSYTLGEAIKWAQPLSPIV